jgi:hypothetical protein
LLCLSFFWAAWFYGLVIVCNTLVKKSKRLYASSSDRRRNIGIHEAVAAAMYEMQGNFVNVNGIDNTASASNTINNYSGASNNDWKLGSSEEFVRRFRLGQLAK